MKQYLIDQIQHLAEKKQELQNDLKVYVQDKSLPLSDRWEIFCLAGNEDLVPTSGWIEYYNSVDIEQYLADRQRYSTVYLEYAIEFFEERDDDKRMEDEEINTFKEEILNKFIWSFELDW